MRLEEMEEPPESRDDGGFCVYGTKVSGTEEDRADAIHGEVVAELVNKEQAAGWNQVVWNANVSSGLYFYRLEAVSVSDPSMRFVDVKKMVLLK